MANGDDVIADGGVAAVKSSAGDEEATFMGALEAEGCTNESSGVQGDCSDDGRTVAVSRAGVEGANMLVVKGWLGVAEPTVGAVEG